MVAVGALVAGAAVAAFAAPSQAQDAPPSTNNFVLAGVRDISTGAMVSIDQQVTGDFAYCSNPNGLGAEAYLQASSASGFNVRHATVTPFVVPIHIGLLRLDNPDPASPINEEALTLGVVKGTPVEFGTTGPADVEYSGLFFSSVAAGVLNWRYNGTITCTDSVVMPIIEPLLQGQLPTAPTTTVAPATTVPTTTAPAPTTTVAETTTTLVTP